MDSLTKVPVKLPETVIPKHYDLSLYPDLVTFRFKGEVRINIDIKQRVKIIKLHAKELKIIGCVLRTDNMKYVGKSVQEEHGVLRLEFSLELPPQAALLEIAFEGIHNDQMAGFYRSRYLDQNGKSKVMVSTQFESLDARRCFPCWDEPARKATFTCRLIVPDYLEALSNMPVTSRTKRDGQKIEYQFEKTPKMSTYLLAFVVGQFNRISEITKHGVKIQCITPPGRSQEGRFALDIAVLALDFYDDFFEQRYVLPKLDMVAIPEFAAGAMENWGLVTYRDVDLLLLPDATVAQRQRVAKVVVHELAHQWFGNLVTMAWWDDLWLNEGFACWMESYSLSYIKPEWKSWDQFVSMDMTRAQNLDSLRSSHPIQVPIGHAEEVEQVFDAISYSKGACIVNMVFGLLGEDAFRTGIREYMNTHAYGNTKTEDLWESLESASGKDVKAIMSSWTEQMGYPLLKVRKDGNTFRVGQSWFLGNGDIPDDRRWQVPMSYIDGTGKVTALNLLVERESEFAIQYKDWFKLNGNQRTMARVLYTPDMYMGLITAAMKKEMQVQDRIGLVSDAYALCKSGHLSPQTLFNVLCIVQTEDNVMVWETLAIPFMEIRKTLQGTECAELFNPWVNCLVAPAFKVTGWDFYPDEDMLHVKLRRLVLNIYSTFTNDTAFVEEARKRFYLLLETVLKQGKVSTPTVPKEIREIVYKTVLRNGGETEFADMLKILENSRTIAERKQVYGTLGYARTKELKRRVCQWAWRNVKLQDMYLPFCGVRNSGLDGSEVVWQYFKEHHQKITERYKTASPSLLTSIIFSCCANPCTEEHIKEVQAFFIENQKDFVHCSRKIEQMLERMKGENKFRTILLNSKK